MTTTKPATEKRIVRVVKLRIIRPLDRDWPALGQLLRDTRYRVWRLANMMMSESALFEHRRRTSQVPADAKRPTVDQLNKVLGQMLRDDPKCEAPPLAGALNGYITGGMHSKLQAELVGSKWKEYLCGNRALPTFRRDMPIPLRGGPGKFTPLAWSDEHKGYIFEPRLTLQPYPKVLVGVPDKDVEAQRWLHNLANNPDQDLAGWRTRSFEISEDADGRWWLRIAYDVPQRPDVGAGLDPDTVVGVKVAYNCPLSAYCDGERIGERETGWIGARIAGLRNTVDRRRRSIQMGGRKNNAVRAGRGVRRKLKPTETLQSRIDDAQTTYNHTLSRMVIDLALKHHAGTIQLEDLTTLKDATRGTFLGINWRYYQLQQQIAYKAAEWGIQVVKVNPMHTVQRCTKCGFIDLKYDKVAHKGRYQCRQDKCTARGKWRSADQNAAENLAVKGIEKLIEKQLKKQA